MQLSKNIQTTQDGRTMLNLGCGSRYNQEWNNVDFGSWFVKLFKNNSPIIYHDLRKGIPFPDNSFDVVYHSNFLEHLERMEGRRFLEECHRVLKNEGVMRVVVPDLELLANEYLASLNKARKNQKYNRKYQLSLLNLIDQMTRVESGGHLLKFYQDKANKKLLTKKLGKENLRHYLPVKNKPKRLKKLLKGFLSSVLYYPRIPKETGELHKWMYDSYSLKNLLVLIGFKNVEKVSYDTSRIKDWSKFHLDENKNGSVYKPDCFFMEASK